MVVVHPFEDDKMKCVRKSAWIKPESTRAALIGNES